MISIDQVRVEFGGEALFDNISFLITQKDRIGLVGKNGAGKSTLLKILNSTQKPTSGNVSAPKDFTKGYLPQQMVVEDTRNLIKETEQAFKPLLDLKSKIEKAQHAIENRKDYESEEYMKLIHDLTELSERLEMMGGSSYEADIEKTLLGLGFKPSDFGRHTSEFSGGWRMRVELAKILLKKPGILLLDEPTNHLDIESIQWLEDFLKDYSGAVVLVSHDRAFLDNVTNRTIEISMGKIYDYKTSYSRFVELRKERREQQKRAYENQQKMIQDTEEFIERFRYKATKAVQVQSRIKQLEKIDKIEIDEEDKSSLNLKFPPAPRSGTIVVEANGLSKNYGDLQVLKNIDLVIERGDKVAFVGKNGEGKTTLARIIADRLDYTGNLKMGHNVKIGYFAQNQADLMDGERTVFQTIDDVAVGDIRTKIRDILGAFMFSGGAVDKKVKVLSGGERTRLAMIKLLLEPVNLLVLDEPTNHLDMTSKDVLKGAVKAFNGTVILVSHDREFLDGLADKVYEFRNRKLKEHLGGIYDFLRARKLESLQELETNAKAASTQKNKPASSSKEEFIQKKEQSRKIQYTEREIKTIESEINRCEEKIREMDGQMQNPGAFTDDFYKQYEGAKQELDKQMRLWEQKNYELEIIQSEQD